MENTEGARLAGDLKVTAEMTGNLVDKAEFIKTARLIGKEEEHKEIVEILLDYISNGDIPDFFPIADIPVIFIHKLIEIVNIVISNMPSL